MNGGSGISTEGLVPLGRVPRDVRVVVSRLDGGRRLSARLADMGIVPGAPLKVVRDGLAGPLVIELRGGRLALGRGMAEKVWVRRNG